MTETRNPGTSTIRFSGQGSRNARAGERSWAMSSPILGPKGGSSNSSLRTTPMRAHRMLWMLEERGLGDRIRPLDFARRHDDAEFLEASPTGSTPAIDDGEVRVFESCAGTVNLISSGRDK